MADWKYVPEFVYEQVLAVSGVCLRGLSGPFSSWAALWRRTSIGIRTQWSGQVRLPSQQECAGLRKAGYLRRAEYSWSGKKRTLRHSRIEPTSDDPVSSTNFTILQKAQSSLPAAAAFSGPVPRARPIPRSVSCGASSLVPPPPSFLGHRDLLAGGPLRYPPGEKLRQK